MESFKIPTSLENFVSPYPKPQELLDAAHGGGESARLALARLWLSEGIPYAFRASPAVYESVRFWLSTRLEDVHAKEISVTGSARLGGSLAPQKLGKPFDENSDLDIFIVSNPLFQKLKNDFCLWASDFGSGMIKARGECEQKLWNHNKARGAKLIDRGFMDSWLIPNYPNYPTAKKMNNTMWRLVEMLKVTHNAPKPKKASVRCYSSWDSFVRQMLLNLDPGRVE